MAAVTSKQVGGWGAGRVGQLASSRAVRRGTLNGLGCAASLLRSGDPMRIIHK